MFSSVIYKVNYSFKEKKRKKKVYKTLHRQKHEIYISLDSNIPEAHYTFPFFSSNAYIPTKWRVFHATETRLGTVSSRLSIEKRVKADAVKI